MKARSLFAQERAANYMRPQLLMADATLTGLPLPRSSSNIPSSTQSMTRQQLADEIDQSFEFVPLSFSIDHDSSLNTHVDLLFVFCIDLFNSESCPKVPKPSISFPMRLLSLSLWVRWTIVSHLEMQCPNLRMDYQMLCFSQQIQSSKAIDVATKRLPFTHRARIHPQRTERTIVKLHTVERSGYRTQWNGHSFRTAMLVHRWSRCNHFSH